MKHFKEIIKVSNQWHNKIEEIAGRFTVAGFALQFNLFDSFKLPVFFKKKRITKNNFIICFLLQYGSFFFSLSFVNYIWLSIPKPHNGKSENI